MSVRRLVAVVCLTLSVLMLLVACSNDATVPSATSAPAPVATLAPTQQPTPVPTPTPTEQPTPEPTLTPEPTPTAEPTPTQEPTLAPPNTPPTVVIASPSTGMSFQTTDSISFTGSATDPEDGDLTGALFVWTSDIDGQLGTGGSISTILSAGTHNIVLTASDSHQNQGSSSLSVIVIAPIPVGPVALPAVIINAIPHVFVGTATIGGQPAPDGTEVSVWVSDYDAPVGTETVSGGNYSVTVLKYGDAFAGKTLIFKIADKDTGTTASWERGEATILNLATD